MFAFAIDCGDQLRNGHATLAGNLLQTVPELVFKADARLVACNNNRALENRSPHDSSSRKAEIDRGPLLNRCANNFNLWPQQHGQRRALKVSLGQFQWGATSQTAPGSPTESSELPGALPKR